MHSILVVERNIKQQQKVWEDKLGKINSVAAAAKRLQEDSFSQNFQNKPVGRPGTLSETFPTNHVQ